MSEGERREFMVWYNEQKLKVFDNAKMMSPYCVRHIAYSDANS